MPRGNIYFHEFLALLGIGAAAALTVVGAVSGSVHLSQPGTIDGIRDQINGALAPFDVQI